MKIVLWLNKRKGVFNNEKTNKDENKVMERLFTKAKVFQDNFSWNMFEYNYSLTNLDTRGQYSNI